MKKHVRCTAAAAALLALFIASARKSSAAGESDQTQRLIAVVRATPGAADLALRQSSLAVDDTCFFIVDRRDGQAGIDCAAGTLVIPSRILADQGFVEAKGALYDRRTLLASDRSSATAALNGAEVNWMTATYALRQFIDSFKAEAEQARAAAQDAAARRIVDQIIGKR